MVMRMKNLQKKGKRRRIEAYEIEVDVMVTEAGLILPLKSEHHKLELSRYGRLPYRSETYGSV